MVLRHFPSITTMVAGAMVGSLSVLLVVANRSVVQCPTLPANQPTSAASPTSAKELDVSIAPESDAVEPVRTDWPHPPNLLLASHLEPIPEEARGESHSHVASQIETSTPSQACRPCTATDIYSAEQASCDLPVEVEEDTEPSATSELQDLSPPRVLSGSVKESLGTSEKPTIRSRDARNQVLGTPPSTSLADLMPAAAFKPRVPEPTCGTNVEELLQSFPRETASRSGDSTNTATSNSVPEPSDPASFVRPSSQPTLVADEVLATAQKCVLRDPNTDNAVFTMTIPAQVQSSAIDEAELAEKRSAANEARKAARLHRKPQARRPKPLDDLTSSNLLVSADPITGIVEVDAVNVDVAEFLSAISAKVNVPIIYSPHVKGAITARFETRNLTEALRDLLEPFEFAVIHEDQRILVHPVDEEFSARAFPDHAAGWIPPAATYSEWTGSSQPGQPRHPSHPSQPSPFQPLTRSGGGRRPTGLPARTIDLVSVELPTSAVATAPRLRHPAADQEPATRPIRRTPEEIRVREQQDAVIDIAQAAQDAFAANEERYAIELLKEGIVRFPTAALLRRLLGEGYMLQNDLAAAEAVLMQAVASSKKDALANELLGKTLLRQGQKQRGRHYLMQSKMLAD